MVKTEDQIVNTDVDTFMKGLGQYYGVKADNYNVKKGAMTSKGDTARQATFVVATLSDGNNDINCGIQILPYGWYYFGY